MKKTFLLFLTFLVILSFSSLRAQGVERFNIVGVDTAIHAASVYLPHFYKGDWTYHTHFIYYDLDNKPAAYAIVFHKTDHVPGTLREMRIMIEKEYQDLKNQTETIDMLRNDSQLSGKEKNESITAQYKKLSEIKNAIQGIDHFATVLTGAIDTSPVILKCHKGMPETFYREFEIKDRLKKKYPNTKFDKVKVIYLGLFEIFYEIAAQGQNTDSTSLISLNGEKQLYHLRTGQLFPLKALKTKIEERKLSLKQDQDPKRIRRMQKNREIWKHYINMKEIQSNDSAVRTETGPPEKLILNKISVKKLSTESKENENPQKLTQEQTTANTSAQGKVDLKKPDKVKEAKEEKKRKDEVG